MSTYKGFTSVQLRAPEQSRFDLSHERKLSTRMGKLTPIFISEVIPNDTFRCSSEIMMRLAPLIAPIMHRVNVFVHFFFVPNRLLWNDKEWETFITGGRTGVEATPVPPYATIQYILQRSKGHLEKGSLSDYLGIPRIPDADATSWANRRLNLMPHAAYYRCWYDYYRDRNFIQDNTYLPLSSGQNHDTAKIDALFETKYRSWQHDYFTSALPFTQRGAEVLMPLDGTGTVTYLSTSEAKRSSDGGVPSLGSLDIGASGTLRDIGNIPVRVENIDSIEVNTSDVSINDLRRAVRLQEWLERNALAGSRLNESIMAHFGRRTSDARLQRAEYLGGGKVNVQISEVVTTAFSSDQDENVVPVGNMAGHGISFGNTNYFKRNFEEWGFVVGIMSVMPTSAYMQGVPRMFTNRQTFLDYPWPAFAHLGEQEVYDSEIYFDPNTWPAFGEEQEVFGYQSRYADWKYMPSTVHGDFRGDLDFWHLARSFEDVPALGAEFNTFEDVLQDRIFAVSGVDTLWCYIYNKVSVTRSLPYFGTPML